MKQRKLKTLIIIALMLVIIEVAVAGLVIFMNKVQQDNASYVRIYHEKRLQESIKVADELKRVLGIDEFSTILVATDSNFSDALSGTYLAARKNAPILLVDAYSQEDAFAYIRKNLIDRGTVYILGSYSSISASFEEGLIDDLFIVKRLEGSSRYLTNLEILKEGGKGSGDIIVTNGSGFADSLSCGAVGLPVLMVDNNSTSLKSSQKKYLKANVSGKIYILGDKNAVNKSLEKQLKAYGSVTRIGGSSRWKTTRLVADQFFPKPSYVVLATGNDFADGLIASPLAYALKSPLLMAASDKMGEAKAYVTDKGISKAYIIGSKAYITDEAARNILLLDKKTTIVKR